MTGTLPLLPFERIAKKNGIRRITRNALEELRDITEEDAIDIAEQAVKISRHANRKTVMIEDIKFVVKE